MLNIKMTTANEGGTLYNITTAAEEVGTTEAQHCARLFDGTTILSVLENDLQVPIRKLQLSRMCRKLPWETNSKQQQDPRTRSDERVLT